MSHRISRQPELASVKECTRDVQRSNGVLVLWTSSSLQNAIKHLSGKHPPHSYARSCLSKVPWVLYAHCAMNSECYNNLDASVTFILSAFAAEISHIDTLNFENI